MLGTPIGKYVLGDTSKKIDEYAEGGTVPDGVEHLLARGSVLVRHLNINGNSRQVITGYTTLADGRWVFLLATNYGAYVDMQPEVTKLLTTASARGSETAAGPGSTPPVMR